jgi:hypothetical protein
VAAISVGTYADGGMTGFEWKLDPEPNNSQSNENVRNAETTVSDGRKDGRQKQK